MKTKLQELIKSATKLNGNCAEFGVWRGASAAQICYILNANKTLYLFDSFQGLPKPSEYDNMPEGEFSDTSIEVVNNALSGFKNKVNIKIIPGWFKDTIGILKEEELCFVNIDCDFYNSYKLVLDYIWPRMVRNGIIRFDNYYEKRNCPGASKAVDEFIKTKNIKLNDAINEYWIIK